MYIFLYLPWLRGFMNDLLNFAYENREVRTILINGEPWWVTNDLCDVLEYMNSHMALEMLDEYEKGVNRIYTLGSQDMNIIHE